ncbi:hypothetical protein CsSME_00028377 [Camellia sinensis var. sinensis]
MTMTPYDFAMITSLGVGGDLIPFDTDMGEWNTVGLYLLSDLVTLPRVQPMEELPLSVPYSIRYDKRCAHGDEGARAPAAREVRRATSATRARARGAPRTG